MWRRSRVTLLDDYFLAFSFKLVTGLLEKNRHVSRYVGILVKQFTTDAMCGLNNKTINAKRAAFKYLFACKQYCSLGFLSSIICP